MIIVAEDVTRTLMHRVFSVLACVLGIACGGSQTVVPTAPTPPANDRVTRSISGFVRETTPQGAKPVGGVTVFAWVELGAPGAGSLSGIAGYSTLAGETTDSSGHYILANVPDGAAVTLQLSKAGYVQQCAAPTVEVRADATLDLQLVARANISADPSGVAPVDRTPRVVSGVVFESTPSGRQPIAGAFVYFEPLLDFPAATTTTDANGRFFLCGISNTQYASFGASAGVNRVAYVPLTGSDVVEIELP
jgi:hypothetical protein